MAALLRSESEVSAGPGNWSGLRLSPAAIVCPGDEVDVLAGRAEVPRAGLARPEPLDGGVWLPALAAAGVIEPGADAREVRRIAGGSNGNGTHALRDFYSTTLQDAGGA